MNGLIFFGGLGLGFVIGFPIAFIRYAKTARMLLEQDEKRLRSINFNQIISNGALLTITGHHTVEEFFDFYVQETEFYLAIVDVPKHERDILSANIRTLKNQLD